MRVLHKQATVFIPGAFPEAAPAGALVTLNPVGQKVAEGNRDPRLPLPSIAVSLPCPLDGARRIKRTGVLLDLPPSRSIDHDVAIAALVDTRRGSPLELARVCLAV